MIAAVLLDREHRSKELDHDPFYGSLREPMIKVIAFLRAMNFQQFVPLLELDGMDRRSMCLFQSVECCEESARAHTVDFVFRFAPSFHNI